MKKLFLLLIVTTLIFGCEKNNDKPKQKVWNPNAMVLIKPDKTAFKTKAKNTNHLTALEIVKQGRRIEFMLTYNDNVKVEKPRPASRAFSEGQKDYTIPALKMWGTDIIDQDGVFQKDFIYCHDVVVSTPNYDTIAYIPNQVLRDIRIPMETAYNEGRYEDVYRMFDEAFTFRPITGAEWRKLKEKGLQ